MLAFRTFASLLFVLLLSSGSASAARVIYLKGPAEQSADGKAYRPLADTDTPSPFLKTAKGGWLIVELKDGSRVKMVPESNLQIVKDEKDAQEVRLESGAAFSNVKKQTDHPPHFLLRTRSVVLGVRGTSFFTSYGKKTEGEIPDEWMCVEDGLVEVADAAKKTVQLVRAGEGVLIDAKKGITAPKAYEWTKKLNWSMDPAAGNIESKVDLDSAYSNLRRLIYE